MNNNKILSDSDNKNVEAKKPKRVEWLNVYAKGFIVESINNNYKNQNISIKIQNKKTTKNKNINPRNLNSIISTYSKQGIKSNKTIISNSNLSSKKTNFSHIIDEDDDFYSQNKFLITNLNHIFSENVTIKKNNKKQNKIGLKKNISNKNIKSKNNKNIVIEKKFEKSNSVKNIITARTQRKKNINKKIKKIILKKDISSPLINYLDFRKKNMNKNIFTQINKKKKNKINKNNSFIHFGTNTLVIDKENNKNKNKKRFSSPKDEKEELDEIEIQKYMVEGRKYKKYKDKYGFDINCASNRGDYSFDDEKDLYSF
jgi:hypothetical protein